MDKFNIILPINTINILILNHGVTKCVEAIRNWAFLFVLDHNVDVSSIMIWLFMHLVAYNVLTYCVAKSNLMSLALSSNHCPHLHFIQFIVTYSVTVCYALCWPFLCGSVSEFKTVNFVNVEAISYHEYPCNCSRLHGIKTRLPYQLH